MNIEVRTYSIFGWVASMLLVLVLILPLRLTSTLLTKVETSTFVRNVDMNHSIM
jgi:hypothetical protein